MQRRTRGRWLQRTRPMAATALFATAVVLVAAALTERGLVRRSHVAARESARTQAAATHAATNYESLLEEIDEEIAFWTRHTQSDPRRWTAAQRLAEAHMRRAKLSGNYADYAAGERALHDAFTHAPEGAGPFLSRARLNFTLHRLDRVEGDLRAEEKRILLDDRLRAAIVGSRADVAFQRGHYKEALAGYQESLDLHRNTDALCRLAHYQWKTGDFAAAEATYDEAEGMVHGETPMLRAWFDLQRGLLDLDRGGLEAALLHYRDAGAHLAHWWLIDEHVAEIHALRGENAIARAMYTDLVERTGNPEFMGALAALSQQPEKGQWLRKAQQVYERRMSTYREATLGHALEHAIETGDARASEWAEQNYRLRPGGDAVVLLARAYVSAGETERARQVIEEVLFSPYSTSEMHATAATIFAACGEGARARHHAARARAIDPTALAALD